MTGGSLGTTCFGRSMSGRRRRERGEEKEDGAVGVMIGYGKGMKRWDGMVG